MAFRAIPAAQSVSGRFAEALTLTGNGTSGNFLIYSNLTELMAASAPAGYTVSMWVRTTSSTIQSYASGLADWGNASTGNRFIFTFGLNNTTQLRAQARWATSGDIYSRTPAATINDGNWRMFTWTFDPASGVLNTYVNGVLLETFTSVAATRQILNSASLIGTLGLKNDTGAFINGSVTFDEIWIFGGALEPSQIQNLYTYNSLTPPVESTPQITGLTVSGTSLLLTATNGTPGNWALLQSQDMLQPITQWPTNRLVTFDANRNLTTNLLDTATNSRMFYLLKR